MFKIKEIIQLLTRNLKTSKCSIYELLLVENERLEHCNALVILGKMGYTFFLYGTVKRPSLL